MKTMELSCPSCGRELEVDVGFAGGVCRCSDCGTLMTVPKRRSGQAEAVERAERPDRPDRPDRPSRPASPAQAAEQGAEVELEPDTENTQAEDESTVYTTTSGRQIEVGPQRRIPTARKRKFTRKRVTTYAVGSAMILAVTAGVIFAAVQVLQMRTGDKEEGGPDRSGWEREFNYDRARSPFKRDMASVLGLPASVGETAVIVDAAAEAEPWLDDAKAALAHGLTRSKGHATFELIYATANGSSAMNGELIDAAELSKSTVASFQRSFTAGGAPDLSAAFEKAASLDPPPDQIILITARPLDQSTVKAINQKLESLDTILVDVAYIKKKPRFGDKPPANELTYQKKLGELYYIAPDKLAKWRDGAS